MEGRRTADGKENEHRGKEKEKGERLWCEI